MRQIVLCPRIRGRRGLLVDRYARHRGDLNLPRAMRDDIEQQHTGENRDCRDNKQQDVADYFYQPAHVRGFQVIRLSRSPLVGES